MGMIALLISAFLLAAAAEAGSALKELGRHLRCPYADLWLKHGPEQATAMLGLDQELNSHRHLQQTVSSSNLWGSCSYKNPFAQGLVSPHLIIRF